MTILLIVTICFMIISDFKHRAVYLWQIVLFFVAQFLYCFMTLGRETLLQNMAMNSILLLFIALCICVYIFFRFPQKRGFIGLGDILFVFALTPYFNYYKFLLFMVVTTLLTLCGWGIYYFVGKREKDIPLVSTIGICYSCLLIYNNIILQ